MASTLSLTRCTARGGGTRARSTALPSPLDHARSPPHQVRDAPPRPATVARRMQHPRDARAQSAVRLRSRAPPRRPPRARPTARARACPRPPESTRTRCTVCRWRRTARGPLALDKQYACHRVRRRAARPEPARPRPRLPIPPAWARPPSSPVYCRLSWRRVGIVSVFSATESEWYSE